MRTVSVWFGASDRGQWNYSFKDSQIFVMTREECILCGNEYTLDFCIEISYRQNMEKISSLVWINNILVGSISNFGQFCSWKLRETYYGTWQISQCTLEVKVFYWSENLVIGFVAKGEVPSPLEKKVKLAFSLKFWTWE